MRWRRGAPGGGALEFEFCLDELPPLRLTCWFVSAAGDPAAPPLVDDLVFLTPAKARTTEDLFAMIHRWALRSLASSSSSFPES